jgi:hypothetical protein
MTGLPVWTKSSGNEDPTCTLLNHGIQLCFPKNLLDPPSLALNPKMGFSQMIIAFDWTTGTATPLSRFIWETSQRMCFTYSCTAIPKDTIRTGVNFGGTIRLRKPNAIVSTTRETFRSPTLKIINCRLNRHSEHNFKNMGTIKAGAYFSQMFV